MNYLKPLDSEKTVSNILKPFWDRSHEFQKQICFHVFQRNDSFNNNEFQNALIINNRIDEELANYSFVLLQRQERFL